MRTGVTAILPRPGTDPQPVWAGQYTLNGNGEMTGTHWINDAGYFLGPVLITNTHGVGAAHLGATRWMIDQYADYFRTEHAWAMPVVAETYDGVLNDINALHVQPEHAIEALNARAGRPSGRRLNRRRQRHDHLRVQRRHRHVVTPHHVRWAGLYRGSPGAGQSWHPALADYPWQPVGG